jgi:hypothetical protein
MTGRIADSQMIKDSEVLVKQRKFSEADASSDEPFDNRFDKGLMLAWRANVVCNQHTQKGIANLLERLLCTLLVLL